MKKLHKFLLLTLGLLWLPYLSKAQIVTSNPPFPQETDNITITFNASEGNKGLEDYTGDVYAHTGVITNTSTSSSDWKYVKTNWGVNTPEVKLTRTGNNTYTLEIGNPRTYYGVPEAETILKLAFVFRSATSPYKEAKDVGGTDIFQDIYEPSVNVSLAQPSGTFSFVNESDEVEFLGIGTAPTLEELHLEFWVDGEKVAEDQNDSLKYTSNYYIVVKSPSVEEPRPSGIIDGVNKVNNESVILSLYAPYKEFVYVVGDFNNWEVDPAYQMKKYQVNSDSVHYWLEISGLDSSVEYAFQYFVDGKFFVADPYSEKILDPWNDQWINEKYTAYPNLKPFPVGKADSPVTVFKIEEDEYVWNTEDFERPNKDAVVFYELLIRDFANEATYKTLIDTIGYFKRLGINAIKLMPVSEFDGNDSWGYNPAFHMALDKYYGTKNDFKQFIDSCHANGIAVVMDVVFNHATGLSPLIKLYQNETSGVAADNSIYANAVAKHPFNVFNDLNHASTATNYWMKRVLRHWLEEFKIDGFRFDLSKGHTQNSTTDVGAWGRYDQWRVNHWKDNYNYIESITPGAYVVLEHLGDDSEEKELANYGMLLWGKMTEEYNEATMGWSLSLAKSRFTRAFHVSRGFNTTGLVAYMESHDEERIMYKNNAFGNSSNPDHNAKLLAISTQRTATAAAFLFFIPGPKMMWMFGELGYDISIFADQNGRLPAGSYGSDDRYKTGRKPILWSYYSNADRRKMFNRFSDIIRLRTTNSIFNSIDVNVSLFDTTPLRRLELKNAENTVNVVANFDLTTRDMSFDFPEDGKWYEFFSGDSIDVSDVNATFSMQAAELRIYSKVKFDIEPTDKVVTSNESFHSDLPKSFELNSVYPNPFNPATTIQYSMPSTSNLTIDVIDIMGRQVATLHKGVQVAGVHTLNWDASKAASGIYLIRMQTGSQVFIRKVTLLK